MFTKEQTALIHTAKALIQLKMQMMCRSNFALTYHSTTGANLSDSVFLTGGAIASLLQGGEVNDWDLYFRDEQSMTSFVTYLDKYREDIADVKDVYRDTLSVSGKMITEKAITMKDKTSFIVMTYGAPSFVKSTFDFLHTTAHYDIALNKLYISELVFDACVNKKLVSNNGEEIKQYRLEKFINRGYMRC